MMTKQGSENLDTIQDFSFLSENQLKWFDRTKEMIKNLRLEAIDKLPEKNNHPGRRIAAGRGDSRYGERSFAPYVGRLSLFGSVLGGKLRKMAN